MEPEEVELLSNEDSMAVQSLLEQAFAEFLGLVRLLPPNVFPVKVAAWGRNGIGLVASLAHPTADPTIGESPAGIVSFPVTMTCTDRKGNTVVEGKMENPTEGYTDDQRRTRISSISFTEASHAIIGKFLGTVRRGCYSREIPFGWSERL